MSPSRLKVVLTRRLPDAVETRMRELFDAELNLTDAPMDRAALEARQDMGDRVIANILTFQNGHRPPDRVIPAML